MDNSSAQTAANALNQVILNLPCYEPAGRSIQLDGEALTRNTLLTGSIGSGKTSTLNRILQQLIEYRAKEEDAKNGLIIFDFKQDHTAERVMEWAAAAGRADDVKILDEDSNTRIELFENFDSINELENVVEMLLSATPEESHENRYWDCARRKRLNHTLSLYRLASEGLIYGPDALAFIQEYLTQDKGSIKHFSKEMEIFQKMAKCARRLDKDLPEPLKEQITTIENGIEEWANMDPRTSSNEVATMSNFLDRLTGPSKHAYFGGREKETIHIENIIERGEILVVSVPALRQPSLAATVGRLIKSRFYAALQKRGLSYDSPGRLAGIIMDEYPLVATGGESAQSDVTQLQAMRSMRGFTIMATQGFEALKRVLGSSETTALLAQIDQHLFFQCKEAAVADFTRSLWGIRYQAQPIEGLETFRQPKTSTYSDQLEPSRDNYRVEERPIVGVEELARLLPGEVWAWTTGTQNCKKPCWMVPLHGKSIETQPKSNPQKQDAAKWETRLRRAAQHRSQKKSDRIGATPSYDLFESSIEDEDVPF